MQSQKRDLEKKDVIINKLCKQVDALEAKLDDIEQWGRRGSMRIQGLPESGEGPMEDKILSLVNTGLKLQPHLQLDEIKVAQRLPRSRAALEEEHEQQQHQADGDNEDANPPQLLRSVIIKFVSRRVKTRVMEIRKKNKCCKSRFPQDKFPRWLHSQKSPNDLLGQAAQKVWGHLGYMGWWFQSACSGQIQSYPQYVSWLTWRKYSLNIRQLVHFYCIPICIWCWMFVNCEFYTCQ